MEETSWTTLEDGGRRAVVHDHRWLAIVGVPLAVFGLLVAIGPWFIDGARDSGTWPILAVGSLIGAGIIVAGLALCFKYEEVSADRGIGVVIRHMGLPPFRRTTTWPLTDFTEVVCLDEKMSGGAGQAPSVHHRVRLLGPNASVLVASWLEPDPIRAEARAWARFLDLPLRDSIGFDLETQLRDSMARR